MTKAVLFDFDGTLFFGTGELNDWCFARALEAMGRPAPTQDILDQTVGMTPIDISRLVLQSDDPALVAEFMDRVYALVPEYIARYVRPSASAQEMLRGLRAQAKLEVMRLLGAQGAVFVGDRLEDVESARAAGIPVAGIRNRAYPWEVDGADNVAEDHAQLRENIEALLANIA